MPKKIEQILRHPILNPTGEDAFDFKSDPDPVDDADYIKSANHLNKNMTSTEFINLLTGKYGHDWHNLPTSEILQTPANNSKNVDIAINKLAEAGKIGEIKQLLKSFQASPKQISKMIGLPEKFGLSSEVADGRRSKKEINDAPQVLADQKALNSNHINEMIQAAPANASLTFGADIMKHPGMTPELQKLAATHPNVKLDHYAIDHLLDTHDRTGLFGNNPDKTLDDLIQNNKKHIGNEALTRATSKMSPEQKKNTLDKLLGIEGGDHNDKMPDVDTPETLPAEWSPEDKLNEIQDQKKKQAEWQDDNWDNWSPGKHYSSNAAEEVAKMPNLSPEHAEHIMRHGSFDEKWNLFHNENIPNRYANTMYNKWTEGDHNHGYDLDDFKEKIKKENPFEYDDHYEDATNQAQEDYPLDDYIRDNYSDDELLGKKHDDWINDHLDENYDWNHTPDQKVMGENGEAVDPEEEDYSRDKESHPEYEQRAKAAEDAYDEALKEAKRNPDDKIYEGYDDSLRDEVYRLAEKNYEDKMDEAHEDPEFLPGHLTSVQELRRQKAEKAQLEAAKEAAEKEKQDKVHVDNYIPYRPKEHLYGDNQHHLELAKKYADANGGSIDIGHLNKMYPNMVDKWKGIFGKKGKITSDEIHQHIDAIPKTKYNMSYGHWKPDDMQNLNGQDEMVIRLDHSPESLEAMKKDPETYDTFNKINDLSQRSGHPTNHNTIGWARVDFSNPKHPMIDELQSDFSSVARDYLAEQGDKGKEKAKSIDKIIHLNKNWRETLLNAVTKIAKANGAEKISTHSPDSKAAHTGSDKVHSVYKDSYEKIPRQMGFKAAAMETLPLSEEGKKTFLTSKSGTPTEKLLEEHQEALAEHAKMWHHHSDLAKNPTEERLAAAHKELADHHSKMYRAHHERLQQLDPSHDLRTFKTPDRYLSAMQPPVDVQDRNRAVETAHGVVDKAWKMPVYGFDGALSAKPETVQAHVGHTLPLADEAFKKHIMVLDMLRKAQIGNDDKLAIANVLNSIHAQQDKIDEMRKENPEGYKTVTELTQTLVDLFKELTGEPIEAAQHQAEAEQQMSAIQGKSGPSDAHMRIPAKQDKITHGSKELPKGAIREYDHNDIRQKTPEGDWISVVGGKKTQDFQ